MSYWKVLKAKYDSSNADEVRMDGKVNGLLTAEHIGSCIHNGDGYYIEGYLELDDTDEHYVKLVTPNTTKWAHFRWVITSSGVLTTEFYEGASGGMTGGSSVTPLNADRNSGNTSGLTVTSGVTAPNDTGTTISSVKVGGSSWKTVTGGTSGIETEIILKQNTTYCRKFLSGSDSNVVSFRAFWIELTNLR
jgi:hypothetical protein